MRELCDQHGALLIFDEVQCGLGRTGHLWAYQGYGVQPDMLTAAKPLAGGLPMGAVLMTQRVADAIHPSIMPAAFAGGPLVAAIAEALVTKVSQPAFLEQVQDKGVSICKKKLAEISSPHHRRSARQGLLLGIELDIAAADVVNAGYHHGLLTVSAGPNVLRLVPPLIIDYDEIDQVVDRHRRGDGTPMRGIMGRRTNNDTPLIRRPGFRCAGRGPHWSTSFAAAQHHAAAQRRAGAGRAGTFVIAEIDGELVGCGSLIALTPALAEIRRLRSRSGNRAADWWRHRQRVVGHGGELAMTRCVPDAAAGLFERQGFEIVDRWD